MKVKVALLYLLSATLLTLSCKTTRKDTGDSMAPPAAAPTPLATPAGSQGNGNDACPSLNLALAEFPAVNPNTLKALPPQLGVLATGNEQVGYSQQVSINFGYVCPESDPLCSKNEGLKADYGMYKVCPFDMTALKVKESCVSGTSYWSIAVPDLNALLAVSPTLMVSVRACANQGRVKGGGSACGPETQSLVGVEKSTNDALVNLDKQLMAINQKIQDLFTADLSKSAAKYLKSLEGNNALSAQQIELQRLATNIVYHPHLFAGNMQDRLLVNEIVKSAGEGSAQGATFGLTGSGSTCPGITPPKTDSTDVMGDLQNQLKQSQVDAAKVAEQLKDLQGSGSGSADKLAAAKAEKADADKKNADLQAQLDALLHPNLPEPQLSLQVLKTADDALFIAALEAKQVADRAKDPKGRAGELFTRNDTRTTGRITADERTEIVAAKIQTAKDAAGISDRALNSANSQPGRDKNAIMQEELRRKQALAWIDDASSVVTYQEGRSQVVNVDWTMSDSNVKKTRGAMIIVGGLVGGALIFGATNWYLGREGQPQTKYSVSSASFNGDVTAVNLGNGKYNIIFPDKTTALSKMGDGEYIRGDSFKDKAVLESHITYEVKESGGEYVITEKATKKHVATLSGSVIDTYFLTRPTTGGPAVDRQPLKELKLENAGNKQFPADTSAKTFEYDSNIKIPYTTMTPSKISLQQTITQTKISGTQEIAIRGIQGIGIVGATLAVVAGTTMLGLTSDAAAGAFVADLDKAGAQLLNWNLKKQDIETQQGKILAQ